MVHQLAAKSNGESEDSKGKAVGPALLTPAPLAPALRGPAPSFLPQAAPVKAETGKFTGVNNSIAINAVAASTVQVSPHDTHAFDIVL